MKHETLIKILDYLKLAPFVVSIQHDKFWDEYIVQVAMNGISGERVLGNAKTAWYSLHQTVRDFMGEFLVNSPAFLDQPTKENLIA